MKNIVMMVAMDIEKPDTFTPKENLELIVSGYGPKRALLAVQQLLSRRRPDFLVFTGFCAFVDPSLKNGQIIVADSYLSEQGEEIIAPPDPQLLTQLKGRVPFIVRKFQSFSNMVFQSDIVSPGVTAVDMETYYFALGAISQRIPFITAKVTCDYIPEDKKAYDDQYKETIQIWPTAKPTLNLLCQNILEILR